MVIRKFWQPGKHKTTMQYRVRYGMGAYFVDRKWPASRNWEYAFDHMMYRTQDAALDRAQALLDRDQQPPEKE